MAGEDDRLLSLADLPDWVVVEASLGEHSRARCPQCLRNRDYPKGCPVWAATWLLKIKATIITRSMVDFG